MDSIADCHSEEGRGFRDGGRRPVDGSEPAQVGIEIPGGHALEQGNRMNDDWLQPCSLSTNLLGERVGERGRQA